MPKAITIDPCGCRTPLPQLRFPNIQTPFNFACSSFSIVAYLSCVSIQCFTKRQGWPFFFYYRKGSSAQSLSNYSISKDRSKLGVARRRTASNSWNAFFYFHFHSSFNTFLRWLGDATEILDKPPVETATPCKILPRLHLRVLANLACLVLSFVWLPRIFKLSRSGWMTNSFCHK